MDERKLLEAHDAQAASRCVRRNGAPMPPKPRTATSYSTSRSFDAACEIPEAGPLGPRTGLSMMSKRLLVACGAFAFVSAIAPAPAAPGDASQVQTQMRASLRSAKSFVMTVNVKPAVYAPKGGTMVYTVVAPNRYRQQVTGMPGGDDDTIIIGHQVYGHDKGVWDVQPWTDISSPATRTTRSR